MPTITVPIEAKYEYNEIRGEMLWTAKAKTLGISVTSISLDGAFGKTEAEVRKFFASVGVDRTQRVEIYPRSARAEIEVTAPENRTIFEFDKALSETDQDESEEADQ